MLVILVQRSIPSQLETFQHQFRVQSRHSVHIFVLPTFLKACQPCMLPPGQQDEILKLEFFNSCFFSRGGKEADRCGFDVAILFLSRALKYKSSCSFSTQVADAGLCILPFVFLFFSTKAKDQTFTVHDSTLRSASGKKRMR